MVSFVQRSVAAISYEVEPVDASARIVVLSELVANEPVPAQTDDPRAAAALRSPLVGEFHGCNGMRAELIHHTRAQRAADGGGDGPHRRRAGGHRHDDESETDLARLTVTTELEPGQPLRIVKLLAYGWSSQRSLPSLRAQVDAALASAKRTGWKGLRAGQREYLDDVWDRADVELEGDAALQQAVRFAIFHTLQAGARAERRAIPAKGLTGSGYDGHSFWDMDTFVLAVLTYIAPEAAADALLLAPLDARPGRGARARARPLGRRLPVAHDPRAGVLGLLARRHRGLPRQRRRGRRGPPLPVGDGRRGLRARGRRSTCSSPRRGCGARVGHHDSEGGFRIDGVTGPDEYSALADNNVYTNLMAARNLQAAAELVVRHPRRAGELGVDEEEIASWRDAAARIIVPYDELLRVHPQAENFTHHRRWDFDAIGPEQYPLMMSFPYYTLYTTQVVKQADLVLALYVCGDSFTPEQKERDFAYYERITVRDSSLSANTQGIVAAEVGHVELAYDYFAETAFVDLRDTAGNTADGLHIAALAGHVARRGGGLRRHARHRRHARLRPAAALAARAADLPDALPRPPAARRGPPEAGQVRDRRRRAARAAPPRRGVHGHQGQGR